MKKKISVTALILFVLCLLLTVGSATFLRPCGAHGDGAFASCHWAGNVVFAMGVCLTLEAALSVFAGSILCRGIWACILFQAVLAALVPGVIVSLCKMETMRCNLIMKPGALVLSALICVTSAVNLVLETRRGAEK